MFFNERYKEIIDYRSLECILAKCDGDIAFVQKCISEYNSTIDGIYHIAEIKVTIGKYNINYERVVIKDLYDCQQNKFKSYPEYEKMLIDFFQ